MQELLQTIILQNKVQDYLISLAILLFALLFKRVLSGWITKWVIQWVISSKRTLDRQQLKTLVLQPVQMFLLVLFIIIGFNRLHFPDALNIDIYKTDLHSIADAAAKGFLIISFIWLCNRCITFSANILQKITEASPDKRDDQLVQLFREVLRIIVWIGGLLMIIKFSFGFPLSSMLTGLSIVGAALALAFRDSLENLIASFIIFFEKPFTTGDLVKTDKVQGYIVKIGLRSILLHTLEKTYVTIPNKKMSENVVENISKRSARHTSHTITIASSSTAIQIENCLNAIKKTLEIKQALEDVAVFLTDAHNAGYQVTIEYSVSIECQIPAFLALKQTILLEIGTILLEHGLKTFDQPTFWVKEQEK